MVLTWILIGIIFMLLVLSIVMLEWPSRRTLHLASKIHGPWTLPLVGGLHLILVVSKEGIMDMIEDYSQRYPRLIYFPVGGITNIFMREPDDVQHILGSTTHIQKGKEYLIVESWLKEGLLTSFGTKWHARRKLLTPTFHFRILEDSMSGINKSATVLTEILAKTMGQITEVHDYVTRCTLDIIGDTAMGINLEAQSESGMSYLNSIKRVTEAAIWRILSVWQFKEFMFKISKNGKTFYKHLKELHNFTDKTIKERKQTYLQKEVVVDDMERKARKPFLDCLLDTQISSPGFLSDSDIREEVDTFMFEGHDTTSAAISFTLWCLGSFPEVQKTVYEELKEIFGDEDRDVTTADAHRMVYLEKAIKETLRLYPSVPYISRRLTEDCVLDDGTVIPATTNLVIMPYFVHRHPEYFPDPEKFDPERFSEENSVGRHPFAYIPFSAGPRNCIGQKFAMLEMKVTLAKILRKLRVTSLTRRDEFKVLPYLILRPTVPLKVTFSPR